MTRSIARPLCDSWASYYLRLWPTLDSEDCIWFCVIRQCYYIVPGYDIIELLSLVLFDVIVLLGRVCPLENCYYVPLTRCSARQWNARGRLSLSIVHLSLVAFPPRGGKCPYWAVNPSLHFSSVGQWIGVNADLDPQPFRYVRDVGSRNLAEAEWRKSLFTR